MIVELHLKNQMIRKNGQATKGARGMPWHREPMKDAAISDMLRGGESSLRSGDFRMGKPTEQILGNVY